MMYWSDGDRLLIGLRYVVAAFSIPVFVVRERWGSCSQREDKTFVLLLLLDVIEISTVRVTTTMPTHPETFTPTANAWATYSNS